MNQPGRLIFHVPPIDMRGRDEIENELDEEFAFHLEQSACDLKSEGRSSTEAQREARARFGDIETIKRDCTRIAMKERIMLQRINLALMIVVLIVVGLVSVQMFTTQKYNTLALQAITADLAQMKLDAAVARREATGAGSPSATPSNVASVLVEGDVEKPGWYPITLDGATYLHEILLEAGVKEQMWFTGSDFALTLVDPYLGDDPVLRVLKPDQEIRVYDAIPDRDRRAGRRAGRRLGRPSPGLWREVDQKGIPVESGQALSVEAPLIDPDETGSATVYGPWCELRDGQSRPISLQLCDARKAFMFDSGRLHALGIATWSYSRGPRHAGGDWERVSLRLPSASEVRDWMYFEPVEAEADDENGDAVETDDDG